MTDIDDKLETIRDKFNKSCAKLDILDSENRPVGNYNEYIMSFYDKEIRRLLEEQERSIFKEINHGGFCQACGFKIEICDDKPCRVRKILNNLFNPTPTTDKLQISK